MVLWQQKVCKSVLHTAALQHCRWGGVRTCWLLTRPELNISRLWSFGRARPGWGRGRDTNSDKLINYPTGDLWTGRLLPAGWSLLMDWWRWLQLVLQCSVTAPLDDTAATLQYENCCSLTQESASWTKNTVRRIAECRLGEEWFTYIHPQKCQLICSATLSEWS